MRSNEPNTTSILFWLFIDFWMSQIVSILENWSTINMILLFTLFDFLMSQVVSILGNQSTILHDFTPLPFYQTNMCLMHLNAYSCKY